MAKSKKGEKKAAALSTAGLKAWHGDIVGVMFTWEPSGAAALVKVDGIQIKPSPTTLPLPRGVHILEFMFTGAPKTVWKVLVKGAQYPTDPITGKISNEGFAAGYSDVIV